MATATRRTGTTDFYNLFNAEPASDPTQGAQQFSNSQPQTKQAQQIAQPAQGDSGLPTMNGSPEPSPLSKYVAPGYQTPSEPSGPPTGGQPTTGQGINEQQQITSTVPAGSLPYPWMRTQEFRDQNGNGIDDRDDWWYSLTPEQQRWYTNTPVEQQFGQQPPGMTGPAGGTGDPRTVFQQMIGGLPPTVQSLQQIFPQIAAAFPGAQLQGGDIWFPGIGWVDVLQSASTGGTGWQWLPDSANTGAGGGGDFQSLLQGMLGGGGGFNQQSRALNFGPTPQYQTYQFTPRSVSPTGDLTTLASRLVGQQADQAGQLWNMAPVDTTAQRAQAQDFYTRAAQDARTLSRERSAAQGIQGGIPQARLNTIDDALASNLGSAYGNIEIAGEQQDFANRLAAQQALAQAAGQAGGLGGQLFGQDLASGQFDFMQQQAQAGENRAGFDANLAAQLGLGGLNLQQLLGLEGLNLQQTALQQQGQRDWWQILMDSMR